MNDSAADQPLAAIFSTREAALIAADTLRDAGMHDVWIGVTHAHDVQLERTALDDARGGDRGYVPDAAVGSTLTGAIATDVSVDEVTGGNAERELLVEDENDSLLDRIGRFFSGTGDQSLHAALVDRGISGQDALRLEDQVVADDAILIVDAPSDANIQKIIEDAGGRLLTGMTTSGVPRTRPASAETLREDLFIERRTMDASDRH